MADQYIDSVAPQDNSAKPPAEPPQNPPAISQMPPPVTHTTERAYSNPDPTPLWKIVLDFAAVAIGITVAVIYYRQLNAMQAQLGVMQQTMRDTEATSAIATDQVWRAIGNLNWAAQSMDDSSKQTKRGVDKSVENARNAIASSTRQSKASLGIAEQAIEAQTRPWVGIDESGTQVSSTPIFTWPTPPNTGMPSITLDLTLPIRNSGASPALHERVGAFVMPIDLPPEGISKQVPPTDILETFCKAQQRTGGPTLLPGAVIHLSQPALYWEVKDPHLSALWIAICITYEDRSKDVHHSKYLYMSTHKPGLPAIPVSTDHPDWTYVPITGMFIYNADAD